MSRSTGYQWNAPEARLARERGIERELEQRRVERPAHAPAHGLGVLELDEPQIVLADSLLGGGEQLQTIAGGREHVHVGAAHLASPGSIGTTSARPIQISVTNPTLGPKPADAGAGPRRAVSGAAAPTGGRRT